MQDHITDLEIGRIRNIGVIAHIDAGKTTISERFLYYTGKTHRLGNIDDGNTVMDYLDEERNRGITIVAAAATFPWTFERQNALIHLIDTPGHIDFTAEVERSLRICDGALVIFSGVEGVEAQSEKVWRQSDRYAVPKIAFVNKLDRMGANFNRVLEQIQHVFTGISVVAIQLPDALEASLHGVIDLVKMELMHFGGNDGAMFEHHEIPAALQETAMQAREKMIEQIAELSDVVADYFLEGKALPQELLVGEIRRLTLERKICPVLCGAAKKNIGMQPLLDAVVAYLPSPVDRGGISAIGNHGANVIINPLDGDFAGLVFKVMAGGSADLYYLRTYAGHLNVNDTLFNSRTRERIKIKRLLRLYAKNVEPVDSVGPGDIIGVIGAQSLSTGDTLCSVNRPLLLEKITFPDPVISIAVEPRSSKDKDRLRSVLQVLCREDPTLRMREHETGQLLLSGMGELHLEISTGRIEKEFGLAACFGKPRVAFRETLADACKVTGIFNRTIGEKAFFAEVDIAFSPDPDAVGNMVESDSRKLLQLPVEWVDCAVEMLGNALKTGGTQGYPLIYVRARIEDIRGDDAEISEGAIGGAVLDAVSRAILKGTVMLEPLMCLNIVTMEDYLGDISGYLQGRRAVIRRIDDLSGGKHLVCDVPLAEMFGFSKALPKLSGGRAGFSMEPCGYQVISDRDIERLGGSAAITF